MIPAVLILASRQSDRIALIIFLGLMGLMVVIGIISGVFERRRVRALQSVAERLGMNFSKTGEEVLEQAFASFPLFTTGRYGKAACVLSGLMRRGDRPMLVFDYRYIIGRGKSRHTRRQTVVAVRLSRARLPQFSLHPEGVFDRVAAAFGFNDIDLDFAPEFSRRWLLRGSEEQEIRRFFTSRLVQALETEPPICVEGGGDWLVVYRARRRISPDALPAFIEKARDLAALFSRS
ncbi:hypothetical protein RAS1_39240 [Phycisphaerae bacterium RAS1]|nr:hypothetical protein RAS1_39240 [Phycisphaerae bacterium RAS1]